MGKTKPGPGRDPTLESARLPALSEADLDRQCSDLLAYDGWRPLKTDPVSRREWGKGFGELGMADRLYIRYALAGFLASRGEGRFADKSDEECFAMADVMWIEWKRIRPGRRSAEKAAAHQKTWHEAERARGALVLVAGEDFRPTFEDFLSWYRKSGLMRKAL